MKINACVGSKPGGSLAIKPIGVRLDRIDGLRRVLLSLAHGERFTVKLTRTGTAKPVRLIVFMADDTVESKRFNYYPAPPFWVEGQIRIVERVNSPRKAIEQWGKL